ncbi:MAG: N-acetylmuramoyl-L-alanine amidase [Alphaproteobacteria bacterium PA4]|nr:MAG: N-acetylmuramoyl-L-alanine amidase [Alphaproteobacteria bacterium PA4]
MRCWPIPLLLLAVASPVAAARLTGLSAVPGTVTISADGPPAVAHQFALAAPYRLVVDLPAVLPVPLTAPGAGSITGLRAAMFAPGVARLVIELSQPLAITAARNGPGGLALSLKRVTPEAFAAAVKQGRQPLPVLTGGPTPDFVLPESLSGAPRPAPPPVVPPALVEATPVAPPSGPKITPAAPVITPETAVAPPPKARAPGVRARSGGKPLVVIDAGHGGKDVGAISINGGYEKQVTLAIARATAKALERRGKVRVKLTRADDRFIPLGGRVTIARNARADLFISIHADAAPNAEARGASVYTLSAVASDAVAARLAARENKADIIGGVNLGAEAPEVGDIMIDLSRRATTNVSVAFAEILQDELADRMMFRGEFHHFAGFWVLKAPDVPSVLLETGYVTNSEDAKFLFSDEGRTKVGEGIAKAIERHLLGD